MPERRGSSTPDEDNLSWYGIVAPSFEHKWVGVVNFPNADRSRPAYSVTLMHTDHDFRRLAVITTSVGQSWTDNPGISGVGRGDAVLGAALGLHSNLEPTSIEHAAAFSYVTKSSVQEFDSFETQVKVNETWTEATVLTRNRISLLSILLPDLEIGIGTYRVDSSCLEISEVRNDGTYYCRSPIDFEHVLSP